MGAILQFGIIFLLLLVGYGFGKLAEKKHYKSIIKREKQLNTIPTASTRLPPDIHYKQVLVSGNIVVANDYFKLFVAGLKSLFGGQLNTYESLLDRGRREAILRMKQQAKEHNAKLVINVKLMTTNLSMSQGKKSGSLEVYAYGTALIAE